MGQAAFAQIEFATDSPLEEAGFEPLVPPMKGVLGAAVKQELLRRRRRHRGSGSIETQRQGDLHHSSSAKGGKALFRIRPFVGPTRDEV
jgi:hypothetical protein